MEGGLGPGAEGKYVLLETPQNRKVVFEDALLVMRVSIPLLIPKSCQSAVQERVVSFRGYIPWLGALRRTCWK